MVIGIDVFHDRNKNSVLGFCASIDPNFTKFYNRIAFHNETQEISSALSPIFRDCLKEFFKYNSRRKPECIILYRDGVGTAQFDQVKNIEIP